MNKGQLITKNTSYFLRGIAILMVVLSHYFEWGESVITNKSLVGFMTSLGDFGVGIFFFLSGYALYKGYGEDYKLKKYFISKVRGIYIPYLIIVGIISLYEHRFEGGIESVLKYLSGSDYWFMEILFIIYLAYLFIGLLPKYRVFILSTFIIDLSLFLYIKGYAIFWYDAIWCFAIGMLVSKYTDRLNFVLNGFSINIRDYVLCFLGKHTLYIYLLHSFVYITLFKAIGDTDISWYARALVAFVITVIMAFIFNYIYEKLCKYIMRGNKNEKRC